VLGDGVALEESDPIVVLDETYRLNSQKLEDVINIFRGLY